MSKRAKHFTMAGVLLFITFLLMIYPFYNPDRAEERGGKLAVTVSLYPMYDIVKRVGGDKVYLKQIIPFGTEPDSFRATPKDMMDIGNSQLFIYNGLIDPWAVVIADNFPREKSNLNLFNSVTVVDSDPHYWLDLTNYKKMVAVITETLVKLDPVNGEEYKRNSQLLTSEIDQLHNDFSNGLKSCKLDQMMVESNSFGYLSRSYNFKTTTEAKSSKLSSLGNVQPEEVNSGFVELMRGNLTKLRESLDCQ